MFSLTIVEGKTFIFFLSVLVESSEELKVIWEAREYYSLCKGILAEEMSHIYQADQPLYIHIYSI